MILFGVDVVGDYKIYTVLVWVFFLPATIPYSVTKSGSGRVTTSLSDYYRHRLCHLLLRRYYYCHPCPPLPPLDLPPRESLTPALYSDTARCASSRDQPPTLASPVSIPTHQYRIVSPWGPPLTWASPIYDAPTPSHVIIRRCTIPSDPPYPPRLPDSRRIHSCVSYEISFSRCEFIADTVENLSISTVDACLL